MKKTISSAIFPLLCLLFVAAVSFFAIIPGSSASARETGRPATGGVAFADPLSLGLNAAPEVSNTLKNKDMNSNSAKKPANPYYSRTDHSKLNLTDAEWKRVLPEDLYEVSRKKGTERSFTGKYWDYTGIGTYYCAACGNQLFRSDAKFASECGWPSFFEQADPGSIVFLPDHSYGMDRTEALCGRCGGHLGHLFDDGPQPTGKRYCMNSVALDFEPDPAIQKTGNASGLETITLGGGCFWCIEAIFQSLKGVEKVTSGYSGGHTFHPSYQEVCSGETGHAEVVQIVYDPGKTSVEEILKVFFTVHDPTTLNRQGADVGTQYRSVIFYHNPDQKQVAEEMIGAMNKAKIYDRPIVTKVEPFNRFFEAEDYHKEYYRLHKNEPYCRMVIQPKIEKFEKFFKDRIKN